MIDRKDFKWMAVSMLKRAKYLQTVSNDYRIIPWLDVAKQLNMDPANLSKIVTGISDCRVSTFLAILGCLGCVLTIERHENA